MKKFFIAVSLAVLAFFSTSCHHSEGSELKNKKDTLSWIIGQDCGQKISSSGISIDKDLAVEAFRAALDGNQRFADTSVLYRMTQDYLEGELMMQERSRNDKGMKQVAKEESRYFSDLLKNNPNVKQAESGFCYEILKSGNGRQGGHGLVVTFHYKGYLVDGRLFDQTYGNREPIVHVVGSPMFQGMQDALSLMKVGDIWRCYFPAELAFGAQGSEDVPPFSTVIYEIELLDVHD